MTVQAFITDVSQAELDHTCGMKFWFAYMHDGTGLAKKDSIVQAKLLEATHDDLKVISRLPEVSEEVIAKMVKDLLETLPSDARTDIRKLELLYRRLGWLVAFGLFQEPQIRTVFDTLPIADEVALNCDPLWLLASPDRLLQDKTTKQTVYREYALMPPAVTAKRWLDSWAYRMRLHIGVSAAREHLGVPIAFGQIMGLSEGYRSAIDGRLVHPYVYGNRNKHTKEWTTSYRDVSEWQIAPVWEYPGGIIEWVKKCGIATANNQFQFSKAIVPNPVVLKAWISNRLHREREIKEHEKACQTNLPLRDVYFRRDTNYCTPVEGSNCPYLHVCWNPKVNADPMSSGEFVSNLALREQIGEPIDA